MVRPLVIDGGVGEGRREAFGESARRAWGADVDHQEVVVTIRMTAFGGGKGELAPIRRPGRRPGVDRFVRHPGQPLGSEIQHPDILARPAPPFFRPIRGEGDPLAVRREGGRAVVPVAVGELLEIAAAARNPKKMGAALVDPAFSIEPVPEAVDGPHRRHFLLFELGIRGLHIVGLTDFRGEGDRGPVR